VGKQVLGFRHREETAERIDVDSDQNVLKHVEPEDLIKYGLIPEFIGRLPIISDVSQLTKAELVRILSEPKNAIVRQFTKLLSLENVKLIFTDEALDAIAEKAIAKGTGARGLRSIIEELMLDIMFEVPSKQDISECLITADTVKGKAPKLLKKKNEEKELKSA
jgi:ATP-dependent Clp protease ATP-binding subunit ClpX